MQNTHIGKGNLGKLIKSSLILRLLTSLFFVPLFLLLFDYGSIPLLIFIAGLIAVFAYEFFEILTQRGLEPYFKLGILGSVITAFVMYFTSQTMSLLALTLLTIIISVNELTRKNNDRIIVHMSSTIFGIIYTGWMGGHILLLRQLSGQYFNSAILVFLALFLIWMNDTWAFFTGTLFGKHKLLPRISPSKTIEGFIGGMIMSLISALIFRHFFTPFIPLIDMIIMTIVAGFVGLAGDLVESAMKRDASVKDASSILPGHGGVLDRFDSVLFALPVLYYYLIFIVIPRII